MVVVYSAANVAPVNPGSIPAATIINPQGAGQIALQTRTSIGGGISPSLMNQVQPEVVQKSLL